MKTQLIILVFSAISNLSAQRNIPKPDTLGYQILSPSIKNVIMNKCNVNGRTMDSLYLAGKLNLRWEDIFEKTNSFYIVHFVDSAFKHYVFTLYSLGRRDSDPDYRREAGKPYYITGFDTVHVFERKMLLKLMESNRHFGSCWFLFADVPIHLFVRNKVFILLKNDKYTKEKIRKPAKIRGERVMR